MDISDGVARRLRPHPYGASTVIVVAVPLGLDAQPPLWRRSSHPDLPHVRSEIAHQQVLTHVRSLDDLTIDDLVLDNSHERQPHRAVRELLDTFLQYHGYAENMAEFQKPKEERDPALAYHHGLDLVYHHRTRHGSLFFLTAGTRSMLVETSPTTYDAKLWNTARPLEHQSGEGSPELNLHDVHDIAVRYNRNAFPNGFFPLQFVAKHTDQHGVVRNCSFPSIQLNREQEVKQGDYEALQQWVMRLWNHAGLLTLFDKARVDFVIRNEPPGASIVRPVLERLQRGYVDTVREKMHAYLR
ncbi:hypothetical protein HYS47_03430 [Candidatus Woesearchaeota archaeon]|nr:hypothetical protein [Candidatus Woesearchaeota archaeon]